MAAILTPSEHISSYYAATENIATRYPHLQGERRCDVVVVGGGFTGVSAMLHLVERGYDVALVEAHRIDYEWGGNIAISINRVPQFGRIEGNTYYVQGYSGHGVAPTPIAGKILSELVAGESEQFDIFSKIQHWRLPGGKWFANPALAAGMLYYRLKELF